METAGKESQGICSGVLTGVLTPASVIYMNTAAETLTATTVRDFTFHAGHHAKHVPAGTLVTFPVETFENDNRCIYARVAGHPRIAEVLPKSALVPA
jgi:hypothetical protein